MHNFLTRKTGQTHIFVANFPENHLNLEFSATTTECDLCNKNGHCVIEDAQVSCECREWFAGRNCQINLKLLLIVGCVSVVLMVVIACGVSCFCCRDRRGHGKNDIPCKQANHSDAACIWILFCTNRANCSEANKLFAQPQMLNYAYARVLLSGTLEIIAKHAKNTFIVDCTSSEMPIISGVFQPMWLKFGLSQPMPKP